jgi:hypothetical protein
VVEKVPSADILVARDSAPNAGRMAYPRVFDDLPLFRGIGGGWFSPMPVPFHFEHAGWNPTLSTRTKAASAMREDFERQLKEYLDAIRTRMAAADGRKRQERLLPSSARFYPR